MNSTKIDTLQLLYAKPILFKDVCLVYPATLEDIASIGTNNFFQLLHLITLVPKEYNEKIEESAGTFFMQQCQNSEAFTTKLKDAFLFFLHESVTILPEMSAILLHNKDSDEMRMLYEQDIEELQDIIRAQHWLETKNALSYNTKDKASSDLAERFKRNRAIVDQIKKQQKSESDLAFSDMVGSLSVGIAGLNILNIWSMSYYAFYDQLQRMQMKEEYNTNLRALAAGAKINKNKLKYWIRTVQAK